MIGFLISYFTDEWELVKSTELKSYFNPLNPVGKTPVSPIERERELSAETFARFAVEVRTGLQTEAISKFTST